jgi:glycopeptide antibiotics resistance protein
VILAFGILPFSKFVGHSHWEFIKWLPTGEDLRSPGYLADIGVDLVANTALFFPLGFLWAQVWNEGGRMRRIVVAAGFGALLSLGIEYYQVYCHSRFPSIFDVITNTFGAYVGARYGATPIPPDRTLAP